MVCTGRPGRPAASWPAPDRNRFRRGMLLGSTHGLHGTSWSAGSELARAGPEPLHANTLPASKILFSCMILPEKSSGLDHALEHFQVRSIGSPSTMGRKPR